LGDFEEVLRDYNSQFKKGILKTIQLYLDGNFTLDAIKGKMKQLEKTLEKKPDIEELTLKYIETGGESKSNISQSNQATIGGSGNTAKQLSPSNGQDATRDRQNQIDDRSDNRAQLNAGATGNIQATSSGQAVSNTYNSLNGRDSAPQLNGGVESGGLAVKMFSFEECRTGIEGSIRSLVNQIIDKNDQKQMDSLKIFAKYNEIFKLLNDTHSNQFEIYKQDLDVKKRTNELLTNIRILDRDFSNDPGFSIKSSITMLNEFVANTVMELRSIDSTLANQIQAQLESLSDNSSKLANTGPSGVTKA